METITLPCAYRAGDTLIVSRHGETSAHMRIKSANSDYSDYCFVLNRDQAPKLINTLIERFPDAVPAPIADDAATLREAARIMSREGWRGASLTYLNIAAERVEARNSVKTPLQALKEIERMLEDGVERGTVVDFARRASAAAR